ncbi:isopenicillin N synthase family dioxygenase [Nocardioides zeae]|uniref:Isopenicillin N synthase-like dioxygenase n=1 Tax=Nocardioides zeae TaxID=1457234 RepID=A0AAJ1X0B3_9ACTN|nr:2-oxoglutarate and iron-dependent oxygenase domain-containing protein [Nocardioides zeae]MDQ1103611.1 isopenicillin N synthase-like dioxygenase [Nocardioides zeae]
MQILPVVDLAALDAPAARVAAEAARLDRACREVGVVEVVGHGVPIELCHEIFAVTRAFFALPPEEKARVAQPEPDQVRGWAGVGSEGIAYSLDEESPADLKEKMDMGPPHGRDPLPPPPDAGPHLAGNIWPERPAGMAETWNAYYRHMARVASALMELTARSFGLPPDFFAATYDRSISMLRALHYPDQPEAPLRGQMRAGAHTDYGTFTLVTAEDRPGGLEVLDASGTWSAVPLAPGRIVALVGDLFAEWTADAWTSTLHRVVNPPRTLALDSSRLAFYDHPNYDARVDVLEPFRDEAWPSPGQPLTSGEHLRQKYLRQTTFGRRDADR